MELLHQMCKRFVGTGRICVVKEGKKRKLVINGAKLEDAGKITAKTNVDETSADLGVKYNNAFIKGMREFKQCVEREEIAFNVQVSKALFGK